MTNDDLYRNFKVNASEILSIVDFKNVSLLYGNLIGANGIALFNLLNSFVSYDRLQSNELLYVNLIDILGINKKNLKTAFNKLEAFNLVKTYQRDDNFIIQIIKPLDSSKFFSNQLFVSNLKVNLGDVLFDKLRSSFKLTDINLNSYTDVSTKLEELYDNEENDVVEVLEIKKETTVIDENEEIDNDDNNIENDDFNYKSFKNSMLNNYVNVAVFTSEFKEKICNLAFGYGLDENMMQTACFPLVDRDGRIDLNLIEDRIIEFSKSYDIKPKVEKQSKSNKNVKKDYVHMLETTSPQTIVKSLTGVEPSIADKKTITKLQNEMNLDVGFINVLLGYLLSKNANEFKNYNYINKVATEWMKKGINNAEEAIKYVDLLNEPKESKTVKTKQKSKKQYYTNNKKVKSAEPEWLDLWYKEET